MKTKKMPCALTSDGKANSKGEHLVPYFKIPRKDTFIGIKTGKEYKSGYLAYIGIDVGTEDIIKKLNLSEKEGSQAYPLIELFIKELSNFKIGNVVSLHFIEDNKCVLKKEAESPLKGEEGPNLP